MKKIFCIIGQSASGKDSVCRKIFNVEKIDKIGLKQNIMYTTRPMRSGEVDGVEYHFVDDAYLKKYQDWGRVVECRTYNTVFGEWNYFTLAESFNLEKNDYLLTNTLEGFKALRNYFGDDVVIPIYIYVSDITRLKRSLVREENPNCKEICRRFLADEHDFCPEKILAAQIPIENCFENIDLDITAKEIRNRILEYQETFVKRK